MNVPITSSQVIEKLQFSAVKSSAVDIPDTALQSIADKFDGMVAESQELRPEDEELAAINFFSLFQIGASEEKDDSLVGQILDEDQKVLEGLMDHIKSELDAGRNTFTIVSLDYEKFFENKESVPILLRSKNQANKIVEKARKNYQTLYEAAEKKLKEEGLLDPNIKKFTRAQALRVLEIIRETMQAQKFHPHGSVVGDHLTNENHFFLSYALSNKFCGDCNLSNLIILGLIDKLGLKEKMQLKQMHIKSSLDHRGHTYLKRESEGDPVLRWDSSGKEMGAEVDQKTLEETTSPRALAQEYAIKESNLIALYLKDIPIYFNANNIGRPVIEDVFKRSAELNPENSELYLERGAQRAAAASSVDELKAGIADLEKAIQLDPHRLGQRLELQLAQKKLFEADPDNQVEDFIKSTEALEAYFNKEQVRMSDSAKSKFEFKLAESYLSLGQLFNFETDLFQRSIGFTKSAMKHGMENDSGAWGLLGVAYFNQDKKKAAIEATEKAISINQASLSRIENKESAEYQRIEANLQLDQANLKVIKNTEE